MTQPFQHLGGGFYGKAIRHRRPVDHDHRQAKIASSIEFGARTIATGVLGDDQLNIVVCQQLAVGYEGERPTGDDGCGMGQGQRAGLVDQAQQVVMLRGCGESIEVLATDGEENSCRCGRQGDDGSVDVGDMVPFVACDGFPRGTVQRDQGGFGGFAGSDGVMAHRGGKGVGGVDDMADVFGVKVGNQPVDAAKAANALGQGLRGGGVGAAGVGIDGVDFGIRQGFGERVRFRCAAKQQDAGHV